MIEDTEHIFDLLSIKQSRLQYREKQKATYGIDCPPHIATEIDTLQKDVQDLKKQLLDLNRSNGESPKFDASSSEGRSHDLNRHPPIVPIYQIKVLAGSQAGKKFPLTNTRILVGRFPDCDIVFEDAYFSRVHFALQWNNSENTYVIQTFRVNQPILVDDQVILHEHKLTSGEVISVGDTEMVYEKLVLPRKARGRRTK
jgi:pSer/pThr/pTyr-binding forkhead associated (FHA) protein